jgi:hypothetical protein
MIKSEDDDVSPGETRQPHLQLIHTRISELGNKSGGHHPHAGIVNSSIEGFGMPRCNRANHPLGPAGRAAAPSNADQHGIRFRQFPLPIMGASQVLEVGLVNNTTNEWSLINLRLGAARLQGRDGISS